VAVLAGCAELGVVSDGTSISVGRPSRGYLIDGVRLPDRGDGYITRAVWQARDNRFGTDELIDLVTAVARRMQPQAPDVSLVVADLSGLGGTGGSAFHRSHQSGRDADLLYYMRDAQGQPITPDAMRVFNASGRATDGSGITVDVPRTWLLIKELLTAPEAPVQWIFMYQPLANRLVDHARSIGEPDELIARARRAVRQPSDSARHDDHLHVRVYCAAADRGYGCVDIGPMELLAERQAERAALADLMAALPPSPPRATESPAIDPTGEYLRSPSSIAAVLPVAASVTMAPQLGRLLRTRIDRIWLRGWR
jgi:penicillin-insensitive murein endopeptidase